MGEPEIRRSPSRRRRAWIAAVGLPLSVLVGVTAFLDGLPVFGGGPVAAAGRAAVAIRDPVHPVETLGTWLFTRPRLERAYEELRCFTQHERGAGAFGSYSHDERAAFVAALRELDARYERVDVFLMGHTNDYVTWIEELEPGALEHLGLVYNSGCRCGRQAERWTEVGAAAYVAHPEAASHAPFFVHFLRRWTRGARLDAAVATANARTDGFYARLAAPPLRVPEQARWSRSRAAIVGDATLSLGPQEGAE